MKNVIVDRPHTYTLDPSRRRTLPIGWRGEVPDAVAEELARMKKGRVLDIAPAPEPVKASKAQEPARGKRDGKPKASDAPASPAPADLLSGAGDASGATDTGAATGPDAAS